LKRYFFQVSLYMVLEGGGGILARAEKQEPGQLKIIVFHLGDAELEAAEKMIKKAQKVNQLIQLKVEQPPREMKLRDAEVCAECHSTMPAYPI